MTEWLMCCVRQICSHWCVWCQFLCYGFFWRSGEELRPGRPGSQGQTDRANLELGARHQVQPRPRSHVCISSDLHSTTSNPGSSGLHLFCNAAVLYKVGAWFGGSSHHDCSKLFICLCIYVVLVYGTGYVVLPQTTGGNWHLCGSRKWIWPEGGKLSLQVRHRLFLKP